MCVNISPAPVKPIAQHDRMREAAGNNLTLQFGGRDFKVGANGRLLEHPGPEWRVLSHHHPHIMSGFSAIGGVLVRLDLLHEHPVIDFLGGEGADC